jgi:P27 family predicted phage terminase small subunit
MRGRKPKPTVLHIIEGTRNVTRHADRENEPDPDPAENIYPDYLSEDAMPVWDEMASLLIDIGVLTEADVQLFSAYCEKRAQYLKYDKKARETPDLIKTPNGHLQPNPYISMANRAYDQMCKLASEFGITPSSRTRVSAVDNGSRKRKSEFFK